MFDACSQARCTPPSWATESSPYSKKTFSYSSSARSTPIVASTRLIAGDVEVADELVEEQPPQALRAAAVPREQGALDHLGQVDQREDGPIEVGEVTPEDVCLSVGELLGDVDRHNARAYAPSPPWRLRTALREAQHRSRLTPMNLRAILAVPTTASPGAGCRRAGASAGHHPGRCPGLGGDHRRPRGGGEPLGAFGAAELHPRRSGQRTRLDVGDLRAGDVADRGCDRGSPRTGSAVGRHRHVDRPGPSRERVHERRTAGARVDGSGHRVRAPDRVDAASTTSRCSLRCVGPASSSARATPTTSPTVTGLRRSGSNARSSLGSDDLG